MDLNPYIQGAITAIVYLSTDHFLPKNIKGFKRGIIAIAIAVAISLFIQFIIDCITT